MDLTVVLILAVLVLAIYLVLGFAFTIYSIQIDLKIRRLELPLEKRSSFTLLDHILEEEPGSRLASVLFFIVFFLIVWIAWAKRDFWETTLDLRKQLKEKSSSRSTN